MAESPMNRLPDDSDPLPQAALNTLAWIDGKDQEIVRLRDALMNILDVTRQWSAAKRLPPEKQMELIDKYASEAIKDA